jgi:deoxyribose-phosphate aldolase
VIFENAYLTDELKIIACRIAGRAGCDFIKTSTGFAPGGVRTLDAALGVYQAGCSRFGATAAILEDWKKRLQETAAPARLATAP